MDDGTAGAWELEQDGRGDIRVSPLPLLDPLPPGAPYLYSRLPGPAEDEEEERA